MSFVLDPPHGVNDIQLGVSRTGVVDVLSQYGEVTEFRRGGPGSEPGWQVRGARIQFFVYCDASGLVNAIEFARPTDPSAEAVTFRGINLFAEPAEAVVVQLQEAGVDLVEEENGDAQVAYDFLLAFWRDGDPVGPDGRPLYWASILVARPGYYAAQNGPGPI